MSSEAEGGTDDRTNKFNELRRKKIEERINKRRPMAAKQSSGLSELLAQEPEKVRNITSGSQEIYKEPNEGRERFHPVWAWRQERGRWKAGTDF